MRTPTRLIVALGMLIAVSVAPTDHAQATGVTWPSSNESSGCGPLSTSTPIASQTGFLPSSERIGGPYGDLFGRSVGAIRSDTVKWTLPYSRGVSGGLVVVDVHERALPAFQQVAANLHAAVAAGEDPYYAEGWQTWGYAARTVGGKYGISRHTFGISLDINSARNPFQEGPFEPGDPFITDLPAWYVQAWQDAGFCWGGDWLEFKDPMHFAWMGPAYTPGYGQPPADYPVSTGLASFTTPTPAQSTFFAGLAGTHRLADVSGDGAPDPMRFVQEDNGVLIQFVSSRSGFAECSGGRGLAEGASLSDTVIIGDFFSQRRPDVAFVDASGPSVVLDLYPLATGWEEVTKIATGIPSSPNASYLVGDHDWDGTADLYVMVPVGSNTNIEVWDGADEFASLLAVYPSVWGDTSGWRFGIGDRDLDGRPDVYGYDPGAAGVDLSIYHPNTGVYENRATGIELPVGGDLVVADYDGDGRDDIWTNGDGSQFRAWMGGTGTFGSGWYRDPGFECPDEWTPLVYEGLFWDDEGSIFEADIDWLGTRGITRGCNPPTNDKFCPKGTVTRGQMAAFLVRALGLAAPSQDYFTDDDGHLFEGDINRLAEAGITRGCNPPDNDRFCPDRGVTRQEMAAFLVRAMGYTDRAVDKFVDDDGSIFEADIERLAAAGVTVGCNPPVNDRFCPLDRVTREQMAAFLHRALG